MRLICYRLPGYEPRIRPAPPRRAWMDNTPEAFANRCLPLNMANANGWEILSPTAFEASWDGGPSKDAIKVKPIGAPGLLPVGHFGSGVLTFHLPCLFRTEPAFDMFVTGPINAPKDGIAPLTGLVETDWAPYTFTMNWLFTRPGAVVRFEKDEPICHIFPFPRHLLESIEPEFRALEADPETKAAFDEWAQSRQSFNKDLRVPGSEAQRQRWQRGYFHGRMPDGQKTPEHRTKVILREFAEGAPRPEPSIPAAMREAPTEN